MMHISKIKMNSGKEDSNHCIDIKDVYIRDCKNPGWYAKAAVYDFLKTNPNTIVSDKEPFPSVIPALSADGEKYVRTEPNDSESDNLLSLPRVND